MMVSFYVLGGSVYATEAGADCLARYAAEEDIDCPAVTIASGAELAGLDSAFEGAKRHLCVPPAGGSRLLH